jgi:hypothetical protein
MPPNIHQETVRFNTDIPAQARALEIYRELLAQSPDCKSLGSLFPKVLTVLAEVARTHPALCDRTAYLVAKHQAKVLALLEALEAGEAPAIPAIPAPAPQAATPTATAPSSGSGDIEINFGAL